MYVRNAFMIAVAAGALSLAAPAAFAQSNSPADVNAGKSNAETPTYVAPGQRNERIHQGGTGSSDGTTGSGASDAAAGAGSSGAAGSGDAGAGASGGAGAGGGGAGGGGAGGGGAGGGGAGGGAGQ